MISIGFSKLVRHGLVALLFSVLIMSCGSKDEKRFVPHGLAVTNRFLVSFRLDQPFDMSSHSVSYSLLSKAIAPFRSWDNFKSANVLSVLPSGGSHLLMASVEVKQSRGVVPFFENLLKNRRIEFYEPDWLNTIHDLSDSFGSRSSQSKWWLKLIRHEKALFALNGLSLADEIPVIAVFDSGIDYEHPMLKGQILKMDTLSGASLCFKEHYGCNTAQVVGGYLGNGQNVHPYSTEGPGMVCPAMQERKPADLGNCMHGTHVAGLIAGRSNERTEGVCPYCKIMNVRVVESEESEGLVSDSAIIRAFHYISQFERAPGRNLVRVINMSFGKYQQGRMVSLYIRALSKLRDGILVIASAGNEDSIRPVYPAAQSEVIAVGAVSSEGRKAYYSNFGSWIDIVAPGGDAYDGIGTGLLSSVPGGGTESSQGTSMASPLVAGVAGLILKSDPNISFQELRSRILASASPEIYTSDSGEGTNREKYLVEVDGKYKPLLGTGLLDSFRAVTGVTDSPFPDVEEDRTRIKCGALVGGQVNSKSNWLLLLLPVVFIFCLHLGVGKRFFTI